MTNSITETDDRDLYCDPLAIAEADGQEPYFPWDGFVAQLRWLEELEGAPVYDYDPAAFTARRGLAYRALSEGRRDDLEALRTNAQLIDILLGHRLALMTYTRQDGTSWGQIAAALGMSKQGAQDWYSRRIDDHLLVMHHPFEVVRALDEMSRTSDRHADG
jgi:hypothetical protein